MRDFHDGAYEFLICKDFTSLEYRDINSTVKKLRLDWKLYQTEILVNINDGGLVYRINWKKFIAFAFKSPSKEYQRFEDHVRPLLENFTHLENGIPIMYLVECLLRETRFHEWDVIEGMSGTEITEEDRKLYGEEKKYRHWIRSLKVIGVGLAGLLGFFGLMYVGKKTIDYVMEQPREFAPVPEAVIASLSPKEDLLPVNKVSISAFDTQSSKCENKPQISRLAQVKPVAKTRVSTVHGNSIS